MIISDSRRRVFCHIPKNGGSSLRQHFLDTWDDAREYQGRKEVDAIGAATRDLTHITPNETEEWFADRLLNEGYQITAVLRAPVERFSSALLQYIRSFKAKQKHFVTGDMITDLMAGAAIPTLCSKSATDVSCIYFRPQTDFLENVSDAAQDLIVMEDLAKRFPDLPRDNPGGSLPSWLRIANHPIAKKLAGGLGRHIKSRLAQGFIKKNPSIKMAIDAIIHDNRAYIADFYAADQALYDKLRMLAVPNQVEANA